MAADIKKLNLPERPTAIALMDAIERVIYQIAPGKMTPVEVLGCLDTVAKQFWNEQFGDHE